MEVSQAEPSVFVVDDNVSIREAIKGLVESTGLRAETFESTQDFLRHKLPADLVRMAEKLDVIASDH